MQEADFAAVLESLGQRSFAPELAQWVHGTADLPLQSLLAAHGVAVHDDPAQLAQALGLRVAETHGVIVKTVLRASAAELAGFAPGDEWLGVALPKSPTPGWRMTRLDDLTATLGTAKKVTALVSRDKRLMQLSLIVPPLETTWRLAVKDSASVERWLNG